MDVADRLRRQATVATLLPSLEQSSIEGGELGRRQPLEGKMADTLIKVARTNPIHALRYE